MPIDTSVDQADQNPFRTVLPTPEDCETMPLRLPKQHALDGVAIRNRTGACDNDEFVPQTALRNHLDFALHSFDLFLEQIH